MADASVHDIRESSGAFSATGDPYGFSQLLDRLPVGAYMCDAEGLITYFNQSAVDLWDRKPRLNHPEDRYCGSFRLYATDGTPIQHDACWMAIALKHRTEQNKREIVIERPDLSRRTVLAHANPLFDASGALIGAVNVLVDVTEDRKREQEWRQMQATLAHMGRLTMAGEMAAGLAHELNQPLAAIVNCGEAALTMERNGNRDELIRTLEQIVNQAERAGTIIRRLRGFTRPPGLQRTPTDISTLTQDTVNLLASECHDQSVVIRLHTSPDVPEVRVDGVQIQQVLLNLMRNSIEATESNTEGLRALQIRIATGATGDVVVTVQDNGPGLAPAVREQLFYPFVTTKADGVGLGLAISKSIIEAHDGALWVDENHGPGACVSFSLPGQPH